MLRTKYILLFIVLIVEKHALPQDNVTAFKDHGFIGMLPTEIKYIGGTDFSGYSNGLCVTKLLIGTTVHKYGFSGDGFNPTIDLGFSYNHLYNDNFVSLFPQLGGVTWWGGHSFLRSEPLYNINKGRFDYLSVECGAGYLLSLSVFSWMPIYTSNRFLFGLKLGYYFPNHFYFREGRTY